MQAMRILFFILVPLFAQICDIDCRIQELEEEKRGYEARALKHEDRAEFLQFEDQATVETRQHLKMAEENRQKARLVQEEIDRLRASQKK